MHHELSRKPVGRVKARLTVWCPRDAWLPFHRRKTRPTCRWRSRKFYSTCKLHIWWRTSSCNTPCRVCFTGCEWLSCSSKITGKNCLYIFLTCRRSLGLGIPFCSSQDWTATISLCASFAPSHRWRCQKYGSDAESFVYQKYVWVFSSNEPVPASGLVP